MKKKLKIYAVAGMMEYQTIVKVGKNSVKVNFSGGSISNGCMQPARFSTKNLIIQNAIESSDEFMKGRIRLDKVIPLNEEIKVEKPTGRVKSGEGLSQTAETVKENLLAKEIIIAPLSASAICETDSENAPEDTPEKTEGEAETEAQESEERPSGLEEVEVSCKDVAKQYLQDHFSERPAPLRTWDDVQACAAKYGIIFKSPTLG